MGLLLVFIGFLFTLNPVIGLLDILPDAIGFLLIFIGINRLSMISAELNDALSYLKWATVISVAHSACFIISGIFDDIMTLCLTMVFAVIEFGVMFMALPCIADGMAYLGIRYDGKLGETGEFRIIGTVFFAARGFLSVLPELGALSSSQESEGIVVGESTAVDWSAYSGALDIFNVVLTLAVAAFFFAALKKYILDAYRDTEFVHRLNKAYSDKARTDPGMFIRRRLVYAFKMFILGGAFLIDFIGDGKNYIPDTGFAVLSLIAVWLLSAYCKVDRRVYIAGGAYLATSLASWIYSYIFAKKRYFLLFDRLITLFPGEYAAGILLSTLEAAALVLYAFELIPIFRQVSDRYIGLDVSEEFKRTLKKNDATKRSLSLRLKVLFVAFCVIAVSGVVFIATLNGFPEYWMIHLLLNIALFVLTVNICSRFITEIDMRYEKPGE